MSNMYKHTMSYEDYYKLDKDEIEDIMSDLVRDYFKKIPFIKFKRFDFDNYWSKIDEDIERYPSWGHIPANNYGSNSTIHLEYDLSLSDRSNTDYADWQTKLYDELETYFNFFKLTRIIPNIELDFLN